LFCIKEAIYISTKKNLSVSSHSKILICSAWDNSDIVLDMRLGTLVASCLSDLIVVPISPKTRPGRLWFGKSTTMKFQLTKVNLISAF